MCSTCGCKGAEGVADEGVILKFYADLWEYPYMNHGRMFFVNKEMAEEYIKMLKETIMLTHGKEGVEKITYTIEPFSIDYVKKYKKRAETFEAPMTRYDEYCISCGSDSDANSNLCMKCQKMFGVKKASNRMIARLGLGAESFEAQRKLTDIDRDGKPYTGQIYPDHPDLDPVKADRNKDGYMSSWERALGNQVARGMEKYKSERKPSMKRMSMRKTSRKSTSILPSVIVVGVIAAIVGSKIRK